MGAAQSLHLAPCNLQGILKYRPWCTHPLSLTAWLPGVQGQQVQLQHGVLRTNCIDCLDRTNVAQFAYGLTALGQQLHALGLADMPNIEAQSSAARELMDMYEEMGNVLSRQVGSCCIVLCCAVPCQCRDVELACYLQHCCAAFCN